MTSEASCTPLGLPASANDYDRRRAEEGVEVSFFPQTAAFRRLMSCVLRVLHGLRR